MCLQAPSAWPLPIARPSASRAAYPRRLELRYSIRPQIHEIARFSEFQQTTVKQDVQSYGVVVSAVPPS